MLIIKGIKIDYFIITLIVIIVAHNLELLEIFYDKVYILNKGQVTSESPPHKIIPSYQQSFLS
jgi:ABC-type cobalt transport system, ATPase component